MSGAETHLWRESIRSGVLDISNEFFSGRSTLSNVYKSKREVIKMFSDLTLDQHCHVHEHVVELADGSLQLDDVGVSRLDVGERLFRLLRLHYYLEMLGSRFYNEYFAKVVEYVIITLRG